MIYRLRKKFIIIYMLSFAAVFVALFVTILVITVAQTNSSLDNLADIVSENDGKFPEDAKTKPQNDGHAPPERTDKEAPFTTRYFTVRFNENGEITGVDVGAIASVTEEQAKEYAAQIQDNAKIRGWLNGFRYKKYETDNGSAIVFVNGSSITNTNRSFLLTALAVFLSGSVVILILVILISKRAVRPAAESYEKQKRFITDANHELKTPLTLIKTNIDIMEAEYGSNEWLSDIKDETRTMTELVNRLVQLARMDEEQTKLSVQKFNLSEAVSETVSAFEHAVKNSSKELETEIEENVFYDGDEGSIRQLVSILMDNAVKYCENGGRIKIKLTGGKRPVISVDNTFYGVSEAELDKLFDRFYRGDEARTYGNGFGVGLSIAQAVVQKHKGSISAKNIGGDTIRFTAKL